jgi:hypothetical protein
MKAKGPTLGLLYEPDEEEEAPASSKKEASASEALEPLVKAFWRACSKGDFKRGAAVMAEMHMTCTQYSEDEPSDDDMDEKEEM